MIRSVVQKRISDWLYQRGPAQYYQPAYRQIARGMGMERGRYLDVGCGPGWLCVHVADECGDVEAVGIDHSRQMIEAANRNKGDRRSVQFHEMSATAMTFDGATFDVVSAIQTAHHWRQPDVIFRELHRVLVGGGRCFVYEADRNATAVPDGWVHRSSGKPTDASVLKGWRRFGMDDREWATLEGQARAAGFDGVELDRHGFYRRMVLTK